jgi:hypothetical protein
MSWEKSEIMKEFGKLMEGQGLLKTAEKNPHKEDDKTIKEKRVMPDEDLIEIAHPAPVYVAEGKGDGGLVENQNEQHKKLMEVINKMPTGIIVHRYAAALSALVKMANACDEVGEEHAAGILTDAATKLVELIDTIPFDKAPTK